jgi:hypothetical protein
MRDVGIRQLARVRGEGFISLRDLPDPGLLPEQLREFTLRNMRVKRTGHFRAQASLRELGASAG